MRTDRRVLLFAIVVLGLAGSTGPVRAAAPSLLLDVYSAGIDNVHDGSVEGRFLSLGRVALVAAEEPSSGREVWVSDGTDAGTRPLLDACPGPCSSTIDLLGAVGRTGVFLLSRELAETELWRSDGTRPGTWLLARTTAGGPARCQFSNPPVAAVAGTRVFFSGRTEDEGGCELWTTDGTAAGTQRLREITRPHVDTALHELTAVGAQVFFVASDEEGAGLWRSDGTPEGTVRLHLWPSFSKPRALVAAGSRLFFVAEEEGLELWTSDGTAAGTRRLTHLAPADPGFLLQETGGTLTFVAQDGTSGRELWTSDGTAAGTRPVTRFANESPFPDSWRAERLGGRLVFPANDGLSGLRLWSTAGRPESTVPLDRCGGGCPVLATDFEMVRVGAKVFFPAVGGPGCPLPEGGPPATDLWVSDGTGAGTRRVRAFCACCRVTRLAPLLGRVFFAAGTTSPDDNDLWASDGTGEGTRRLIPVNGRANLVLPVPPVDLGGKGLFAPASFLADPDLWVSDGTPAGTEGVASIRRNGWSSSPGSLVPTPEGARFLASGEENGPLWESRGTPETTVPLESGYAGALAALGPLTLGWGTDGLWRTDGTPAGTFWLKQFDHVRQLEITGSLAVFLLQEPGGPALWSSDGSVAGTRRIFTLPNEVVSLLPAGSWALLSLYPSGRLWRTDGTSTGTREIPLPAEIRSVVGLGGTSLGNATFFRASTFSDLRRIWRTDGTAAGTWPVTGSEIRVPGELFAHGGALYFLAGTPEAPSRLGLWQSTGAAGGTQLLRSFGVLDGAAPEPSGFTSLGNLLFFRLDDTESGIELWRTDGTPAGTVQVRDIAPGEDSSLPLEMTALGGRLYFTAREEEHGIELWETDGTGERTRLVQDIAPGAFSSDPLELTAGGGRLFFTADDGIHGREPWVYSPESAACVPSDTVLCLAGGRFKIEADWRTGSREDGRGHATALTPDTGTFWFFDAANIEVIVKVLDGRGINGHHWVFFGALSNVEYALTVTDTETGAARRYTNLPGRLGSVADTQAFGPLGASLAGVVTEGPAAEVGEALAAARSIRATGGCVPGSTRLCLNGGRFAVEARWMDFQGNTGTGQAVPLPGGDTGYFWFFGPDNVEVMLKILDGRPLNNKFWVFYGALSNVEYTLTVTDTVTGAVKTYINPSGRLASVADTGAF